jgi:quercetin dioxygenase-like cupin family protein
MPYVNPKDANNKLIDNIKSLTAKNDSPPWRECMIATPQLRLLLLCWPPKFIFQKHHHPRADETFIILEGQVKVTLNNNTPITARKNDVFYAEKGISHDMIVVGNKPLLMIAIVSPNEVDDMVKT